MDSPMIASLESCLERQRQRPRALTFALRHPVLVAGSFLLALMIGVLAGAMIVRGIGRRNQF